jgi:hypothetical protein
MATEYQAAMAKLAESTKQACATSADVVKAAAAKSGSKAATTGGAAATSSHPILLGVIGGVIVGLLAYHLASKYWFKPKSGEANP